uniref:Phytanoyl-CoA dioxygenase n=1 Tax=Ditylum brightwellii TaxID=49249 RepID=A0A6U3ZUB2_9STRA|mmetsp:Transcript_902/g.1449  ORF Transcript_902/g.1449 Transcript_902/m.1449 type:complete len:454 (+) Transcript_902:74-1435(+)
MLWNAISANYRKRRIQTCIDTLHRPNHHYHASSSSFLVERRWQNFQHDSKQKHALFDPNKMQQCRNLTTSTTRMNMTKMEEEAMLISRDIYQRGYAKSKGRILSKDRCLAIRNRMPLIFRGIFDTGVYPDEWHWREGISFPHATREICNAWKSDRTVASVVLDESMGKLVADITGWESVRVAQDDLVWKVPYDGARRQEEVKVEEKNVNTVVGFHQDSAYISKQFSPYENNSLTVWISLDDADEESGCVEYAVGSHKWRPLLHFSGSNSSFLDGDDNSSESNYIPNEHQTDDEGSLLSSFHSSTSNTYRDGLLPAAVSAGVYDSTAITDAATSPVTIEAAPVKEGYALFHHQDTWHGSGPNRSEMRHRRALVVHYLQGDVIFREKCNDKGEASSLSSPSPSSPWGPTTYIYGRYKKFGSQEVDEDFFPIVYARDEAECRKKRTAWLDSFIGQH